jgi:hypothetical protein
VGFWVAGLLLLDAGLEAWTLSAVAARTTTERGATWRCEGGVGKQGGHQRGGGADGEQWAEGGCQKGVWGNDRLE